MHRPTPYLLAFAALHSLACGELPTVAANVCGNAIVEGTEECDTWAPTGKVCRPPTAIEGACRFDCSSTGTAADCPLERPHCGDDKICREATGTYEPFGSTWSTSAESLQAGDFDGDGRQDLLALGSPNGYWQSFPRILFFDAAGHSQDIVDPRIAISSPILLSGEASDGKVVSTPQVVFTSSEGIGAVHVTADRTVIPIAYPIQVLPQGWSYRFVRLRGNAQSFLKESVIIFMHDSTTAASDPGVIMAVTSSTKLAPMPKAQELLTGPPVAANVVDDAKTSPCDEVLLTFRGDDQVYLLQPCDELGNWVTTDQAPGAVVSLANSHTISQPPIVTRIDDRDAHLDLLIADETDNATPYIAFGQGDGSFAADPNNVAATLRTAWPVSVVRGDSCPLLSNVEHGFPLAVSDLNGDGLADWVTRSGVQLTQSVTVDATQKQVNIIACPVNRPSLTQWTAASIADFNRDNLLDVVAGSNSEPDLDFLQGTSVDALNPSVITTRGPLNQMAVGDFDGDQISDIAFDVVTSTTNQSTVSMSHTLSIAFGHFSESPETPSDLGDFAAIDQMIAAKYSGIDAIDELGVIATPSDTSGQQLSVFSGTSGRHPIAPIGLEVPASNGDLVSGDPLALAAGNLSDYKYLSLVSVSIHCETVNDNIECTHRLWLVPGTATGRFGIPVPSAPLPAEFLPFRRDELQLSVYLLVGDIDGSAPDEALAITTDVAGSNIDLWRIIVPASGTDWLQQGTVELLGTTPGTLTSSSHPKLADVNGDGLDDLVIIVDDGGGNQRLGIVINQNGSLALSQVNYVALGARQARGFATFPTNGHARLWTVTDDGTYEVTASTDAGNQFAANSVNGLPGGSSIAVGNFAGYGLTDLALGTANGVQLFEEIPKQK
jgi:hypothetical protein